MKFTYLDKINTNGLLARDAAWSTIMSALAEVNALVINGRGVVTTISNSPTASQRWYAHAVKINLNGIHEPVFIYYKSDYSNYEDLKSALFNTLREFKEWFDENVIEDGGKLYWNREDL